MVGDGIGLCYVGLAAGTTPFVRSFRPSVALFVYKACIGYNLQYYLDICRAYLIYTYTVVILSAYVYI